MRVTAYIILILMSLTLPWQFFMAGVFLYVFRYEGIEVLFLAFLLDAYVGITVPWIPIPAIYTIATMGMLVFMWGMKPLFLIESRMN